MKEADKNQALLKIYNRIETETKVLSDYLYALSPTDYSISAIALPVEGKDYRLLHGIELEQAIDIYGQFKAKLDQDPSRPSRTPGVIQVKKHHQSQMTSIINKINAAKDEFDVQYKKMTKGLEPRKRAKRVHSALGSSSFITLQITRNITYINDEVIYMGISYHKKPNIVALSKTEVLNRLALLQDRPMMGYSESKWRQLVKSNTERVELMDESQYHFRFTKGSYYRPMVNVKLASGKVEQPSASIPVVVFTDEYIKVNLPRKHDNAKRRSDRLFDPGSPNLTFANIHIRPVKDIPA